MDSDIIAAAQKLNRAQKPKPHECKYCLKAFSRESTLMNHMCEPKRRWQQEKEPAVNLGFMAFHTFFLSTVRGKPKTYADFVKSPYYNAFVKFGYHCQSIRVVNFKQFLKYLMKENIKLDYWCRDSHYETYLRTYLKLESVGDALERSIKTMTVWGEETKNEFNTYFVNASTNRIVRDILNGRISPWVMYNCDTGIAMLGKCTNEQVGMVFELIDPDFWNHHFAQIKGDRAFAQEILTSAGM